MSVVAAGAKHKSKPAAQTRPRRFHPATAQERRIAVEPPALTLEQPVLQQLLPRERLQQLALRWQAADERQRKLTCTVFFWLAVLAFGPGGPVSLSKIISYALVANLLAGVSVTQASLSKEAVSENLRERPWRFFQAVLEYLLSAHAGLWRKLAGRPNLQVVQTLQVLLIDATVMRVANALLDVFPASRNGQREHWAGLKLHTAVHLFRRVPEVLALSAQKKNERHIDFLRASGEAALYIFDLGYWTYELLETIITQQQQFIARMRLDCNPQVLAVYVGDPRWVGQRLKAIQLSGQTLDLLVNVSSANPHNAQMQHDVRLVGCWNRKNKRWHLYVTSLLDWQHYAPTLIIDLYRLRWQVEILFRDLKHVLQIANFISRTENGVRLQIFAAVIHYVLTQLIIVKAAYATRRDLDDFSMPYCLTAVQQVLQQTGSLVLFGQQPDWVALEALLVQAVIARGLRPNRKRKPLITRVKQRLRRTPPLPA